MTNPIKLAERLSTAEQTINQNADALIELRGVVDHNAHSGQALLQHAREVQNALKEIDEVLELCALVAERHAERIRNLEETLKPAIWSLDDTISGRL